MIETPKIAAILVADIVVPSWLAGADRDPGLTECNVAASKDRAALC